MIHTTARYNKGCQEEKKRQELRLEAIFRIESCVGVKSDLIAEMESSEDQGKDNSSKTHCLFEWLIMGPPLSWDMCVYTAQSISIWTVTRIVNSQVFTFRAAISTWFIHCEPCRNCSPFCTVFLSKCNMQTALCIVPHIRIWPLFSSLYILVKLTLQYCISCHSVALALSKIYMLIMC